MPATAWPGPGWCPPPSSTSWSRCRDQSHEATGAAASNLDLYQVNCTFYDALGRDDKAYLLARAVQFFLPGVPQVYYVGLLAGENDMALLQRTGVGRDINRHHYSASEVAAALQKPVVKALVELIRARSTHPAFGGHFTLDASSNTQQLSMRWVSGEHTARLHVDFATLEHTVEFSG
jgi:sucrose phosphorylase